MRLGAKPLTWNCRQPAKGMTNHEKCPDGIVQEDDGSGRKHGEADELVELEGGKAFG